ncbi:MAG: RluA family pseudouridine synthase [Firmicutes bacterium]|nr:RluA family pseudouridine synthase [Bacillota bacterium]MCL2256283.1 RluA family pseudouridine synthase [Bacillota bacterium]
MKLTVSESGERLDVYLTKSTDLTRSQIKQLLEKNKILLNGISNIKSGKIVKHGDEVEIQSIEYVNDLVPQNLPINIVFEDDDLAVINKTQGMSVHPGGGVYEGTLANAILYHFKTLSTVGEEMRSGIVHRLDKDTSGVMLVAKNDKTHLDLSKQIAERTVEKIYVALLEGVVKNDSGEIKTFITRSTKNRKLMMVGGDEKEALTFFKVLKRYESNTLVEFKLITGRTHQIRVHSKHIGHPVVGDPHYGFKKQKFNLRGQLLHSKKITFIHPKTKKEMTFETDLPKHFENVLKVLKEED